MSDQHQPSLECQLANRDYDISRLIAEIIRLRSDISAREAVVISTLSEDERVFAKRLGVTEYEYAKQIILFNHGHGSLLDGLSKEAN